MVRDYESIIVPKDLVAVFASDGLWIETGKFINLNNVSGCMRDTLYRCQFAYVFAEVRGNREELLNRNLDRGVQHTIKDMFWGCIVLKWE